MRQLLSDFVGTCVILTLDGVQAHNDAPSNTRILAKAKPKPTHVPDDWDDDDEEEETDSQKIWETAYVTLLEITSPGRGFSRAD